MGRIIGTFELEFFFFSEHYGSWTLLSFFFRLISGWDRCGTAMKHGLEVLDLAILLL